MDCVCVQMRVVGTWTRDCCCRDLCLKPSIWTKSVVTLLTPLSFHEFVFRLLTLYYIRHFHSRNMPSVLWRCWLGGRKGIRPVKKTEWWGAGMVICLERGADLHMGVMLLPLTVSCFSKIQIGFTFLVPAHLGSPGQWAVKWVCVCMSIAESIKHQFGVCLSY